MSWLMPAHPTGSSYGFLRVIMHSNNNKDLVSLMSRLSLDVKEDEAVKHALVVRATDTSGNYVMFFRLYNTAPYYLNSRRHFCFLLISFLRQLRILQHYVLDKSTFHFDFDWCIPED